MNIQELFDSASAAYERGDNQTAQRSYQAALDSLLANRLGLSPSELDQAVRSTAFNLAQALNKLGRFQDALDRVDLGMARNPTAMGKAIGLAAKGEALCGLGKSNEGYKAFEEAARAHPITGRLNSADSMLRIGTPAFVTLASEWVESVAISFDANLKPVERTEIATLRKQIADKKDRRS